MSLTWAEAARLAAKGGRADRLRRRLMAGCAALAAVLASAVATVPSQWGEQVGNSSMLGQLLVDRDVAAGVMVALAVMALPVVHLAVQAARVGAPARDRRLEALRAAGATLADARRVVRSEVLVWSSVGALIGLVGYYTVMWSAPRLLRVGYADGPFGFSDEPAPGEVAVIGLDVWPHPVLLVAAAATVPFIAALLVPLVVRRSSVSSRTLDEDGGAMSPRLALIYLSSAVVAGVCVVAMIFVPVDGNSAAGNVVDWLFVPLLLAALVLTVCTLTVGASTAATVLGRLLVRRAGAVGLLAGRMMVARPGLASRSAVSLVLVGFAGGLAIPLQGILESETLTSRGVQPGEGGALPYEVLYYSLPVQAVQALAVVAGGLAAIGLVIAVAEQVTLRGVDLARQVAAGVPRRVVRQALVIESATPSVVMTTVAVLVGAAVPVLSVALTGNADLLERVAWVRLAALWCVLAVGVVAASWIGGFALPSATGARRIRDRE